ncbi:amino acid adenylation domain-containing protein [Shinella sp.]|uniref:non-ribosomal peptide synthetase n=1 Tax=Shinella sp. TaxID=1870904 RepID=UPI002588BE94|nr:amino acid adenylation domain-containing protein [Shinella sp.]MCW5709001.1 amino acid adenylation domain-containing protein [Shinella sp.]
MTGAEPMTLGELKRRMQESRIRLWVAEGELRYAAPQGLMTAALRSALGHHKAALIGELTQAATLLVARPEARHEPYPMTDLQQAYWVGEHGGYAQSATPCFFHHCRFEAIEPETVQTALQRLQRRHEALTARFLPSGEQVIPPPGANPCRLSVVDLRALAPDEAASRLGALCEAYPETLPPLEKGPPLAATLVRLEDSDRLLIAFRLIAIDGPSLAMIFRDLLRYLFDDIAGEEPPPSLSHRDYALALRDATSAESIAYWEKTLPTLSGPPDLPATGETPLWSDFRRLAGKLDAERWRRLKSRAAEQGVTANAAMLALYAAALRPFATHPDFTLNVLANHRPFQHPELSLMTGNCSNTTLVDCTGTGSFADQARRLQALMAERLAHASVSGVSLIRRLQLSASAETPAAPFVFTSGISSGRPVLPDEHTSRFELVGSHLRTPQVSMDHQVIENHEGLIYYWDYVAGVFAENLPQTIFARYEAALLALVDDPSAWLRDDPAEAEAPSLHALAEDHPDDRAGTLPDLFLATARASPSATAIIDAEGAALTYADLRRKAEAVAAALLARGAQAGDIVGITLPKGAAQIVAVVGVSLAGLVWLPLDSRLPVERRNTILSHSGCRWLIADDLRDLPADARAVTADDIAAHAGEAVIPSRREPSDRAYVIYTSGSTGAPKGVVISHAAARNTILDINRRFAITGADRVLALSALSFDLSVYDIWGTLAAGGAIVVPADSEFPDPQATLALCARTGVTVWNSVPALIDMALSAARRRPAQELSQLKTIMLSGDWIPLPLARRLRADYPETRLWSLGGATEAAIWSNFYPVETVENHWTSVPYGFALAGQQLHVLDARGRPCPAGVTGEIHIEGFGLAEGYLNDAAKTAASFIRHASGRRLYRTGDLGRIMPCGAIEFLGRKDFQMKIRGHRIEAGDIEAHLTRHPDVDQALALAVPGPDGAPMLIACHTGAAKPSIPLAAWLAERLPRYMVPDRFVHLDALPLSANGKRDRKAAAALVAASLTSADTTDKPALGETLGPLAKLWADVTGRMPLSPDENFFRSGGNSLLAVHLARAICERFGVEIGLAEIFREPTLGGLQAAIASRSPAAESALPQETRRAAS